MTPSRSDDPRCADALGSLLAAGFSRTVSARTVAVLDEAEKAQKHGHGFALVPRICERLRAGCVRPDLCLATFSTGTAVVGVDAHHSLGYAAAAVTCRMLTRQAARTGCAAALIRNIDHIGAAGVYARRAASRGYLCFVTAAGKARVSPWGANRPMFGTTPLAMAMPTTSEPLVIDVGLTHVTVAQVTSALQDGLLLSPGVARDHAGRETVEPAQALAGSLLAIGGHKGASLTLAVHALLNGLADCALDDHPVLMVMLKTDAAGALGFRVDEIVRATRATISGQGGTRMAGDSYRRRESPS